MLIAQAELEGEGEVVILWSNTKSNIKVAKPQMFNKKVGKISGFLIACRLYISEWKWEI